MRLLSHLKIRTKLASMVCLAALTVTAIIGVSTVLSKSRMMEDRVQQMRTAVELLYNLAQALQDEVAAGKLTQAEAKAQFHQRGRRMSFNGGQGYPVVYSEWNSSTISPPVRASLGCSAFRRSCFRRVTIRSPSRRSARSRG